LHPNHCAKLKFYSLFIKFSMKRIQFFTGQNEHLHVARLKRARQTKHQELQEYKPGWEFEAFNMSYSTAKAHFFVRSISNYLIKLNWVKSTSFISSHNFSRTSSQGRFLHIIVRSERTLPRILSNLTLLSFSKDFILI